MVTWVFFTVLLDILICRDAFNVVVEDVLVDHVHFVGGELVTENAKRSKIIRSTGDHDDQLRVGLPVNRPFREERFDDRSFVEVREPENTWVT